MNNLPTSIKCSGEGWNAGEVVQMTCECDCHYNVFITCDIEFLSNGSTFVHVPLILVSIVIVLWVRHAIFPNAWQAQTTRKKHRLSQYRQNSMRNFIPFLQLKYIQNNSQIMKSVGIHCLLINISKSHISKFNLFMYAKLIKGFLIHFEFHISDTTPH